MVTETIEAVAWHVCIYAHTPPNIYIKTHVYIKCHSGFLALEIRTSEL